MAGLVDIERARGAFKGGQKSSNVLALMSNWNQLLDRMILAKSQLSGQKELLAERSKLDIAGEERANVEWDRRQAAGAELDAEGEERRAGLHVKTAVDQAAALKKFKDESLAELESQYGDHRDITLGAIKAATIESDGGIASAHWGEAIAAAQNIPVKDHEKLLGMSLGQMLQSKQLAEANWRANLKLQSDASRKEMEGKVGQYEAEIQKALAAGDDDEALTLMAEMTDPKNGLPGDLTAQVINRLASTKTEEDIESVDPESSRIYTKRLGKFLDDHDFPEGSFEYPGFPNTTKSVAITMSVMSRFQNDEELDPNSRADQERVMREESEKFEGGQPKTSLERMMGSVEEPLDESASVFAVSTAIRVLRSEGRDLDDILAAPEGYKTWLGDKFLPKGSTQEDRTALYESLIEALIGGKDVANEGKIPSFREVVNPNINEAKP